MGLIYSLPYNIEKLPQDIYNIEKLHQVIYNIEKLHQDIYNIEEEHQDIKDLFAAAKSGKWPEVMRIVGTSDKPKKPYLLNLIPEDRRWGILPQAVYWNNLTVIKLLLQFSTCDISLKVKDGKSEKGYTGGKTAAEIAELLGHLEASKILKNRIAVQFEEDIKTFYIENSLFGYGKYALFRLTIAAYKNTFHPATIPEEIQMKALLHIIFCHINKHQNWMVVRNRVAQSLFSVCQKASDYVEATTSKTDFFHRIINVYTQQSPNLYTYVNTALRRQRSCHYNPTADDLALGPYILTCHLILFFWKELKHYNGTTYRKMILSPEDYEEYQPGTRFYWLPFVSSSASEDKAQNFHSFCPMGNKEVLFVIDNSTVSQWQPLDITKYSCFAEEERVYPAGAQFLITNRKTITVGNKEVYLELLQG